MLIARQKNNQWYWLGGGLAMAIIPLWAELPGWLLPFVIAIYLWRLIYPQHLARQGKWIKLLVVTVSVMLLSVSIGSIFSLQGFVGLLVLASSLKLIELETRRDYLLMVFLGCLISACQLLFYNSVLSFGYTLCSLLILHTALLQMFINSESAQSVKQRSLASILKVTIIFLQALPIAIILFIVMPRIGSIWTVPINSNVAKTGVTDSLTAGDIGQLNQDFSVAMRITFSSSAQPSVSQMYWRGMSLAAFDGKTWRRVPEAAPLSDKLRNKLQKVTERTAGPLYRYQIMQEATGRPWLYSLSTPIVRNREIVQGQDYSLSRHSPLQRRFQYEVTSAADFIDNTPLGHEQYLRYTQLPGAGNPQTRAFAQQLKQRLGSTQNIIDFLTEQYQHGFSYTLSPGKLSTENPIDDFLFNTKRGYCEHFASSSAFLLRAAGVPARIATGYQGGQWSTDHQYLLVTQAQAHAWVEFWDEQSGWVRWDPTAVVAPERISRGTSEFLLLDGRAQDIAALFRKNSWVRNWQLQWDGLNYQWHRWVLGYNSQLQFQFVKKLLGAVDSWRIGLLILLVLGLVIAPLMIKSSRKSGTRQTDPVIKLCHKLDKKMAKLQLHREPQETLSRFLSRAAIEQPSLAVALRSIAADLEKLLYYPTSSSSAEIATVAANIKKLKYR